MYCPDIHGQPLCHERMKNGADSRIGVGLNIHSIGCIYPGRALYRVMRNQAVYAKLLT
jgi:hypothetical protein